MDGLKDGWMDEWTDGWMDGLMPMDGWTDGQTIKSEFYLFLAGVLRENEK